MASRFSNVSRPNKPSTLLKNYTKAYAATTLAHALWLPESSAPVTSGRPWRPIATPLSKNVYPARNTVTSSIKTKNNSILYYPRGPSQSGEWTFSTFFSPRKGQVKFLIVAIDYFTKWIEAKPWATITAQQVQQFVWKDIICRYGIPNTIITDNGRQFIDKELAKFYTGLCTKYVTSSIEHPQTNGQAEAANKVILVELRKRLDNAKGRWPEELVEVLWAYRCTPKSATNESPFSLVYGADAMIPVKIGEPSLRRELYDPIQNHQNMSTHLNLLSELREKA